MNINYTERQPVCGITRDGTSYQYYNVRTNLRANDPQPYNIISRIRADLCLYALRQLLSPFARTRFNTRSVHVRPMSSGKPMTARRKRCTVVRTPPRDRASCLIDTSRPGNPRLQSSENDTTPLSQYYAKRRIVLLF